MRALELKIPPPIIALLVAAAMWMLAAHSVHLDWPRNLRDGLGTALMALGVLCGASAAFTFRRHKTTVNPVRIEATSALVSSGPFRLSRNPMYLGLLLVLLGWAVMLAAPWSLIGPVAYVLYIQRFQILPEERVLKAKFGVEFERYCGSVRRWI